MYAGYICLSDKMKEEAYTSIQALRKEGIKKCIMISGDKKAITEEVGKETGMDEVYGECLPANKVEYIEQILKAANKHKVAYVGDGVNDAPVLMRADIGIAMGCLGSDAAIEAADIVIMDDQLSKLPIAIKHARKCMKIVYQNIVFAIGVKFLCLILGALGLSNMWMAIFADVGVMFIAVLNALRALL
jgi:Cd2+/Zn2+-exporting ATPase